MRTLSLEASKDCVIHKPPDLTLTHQVHFHFSGWQGCPCPPPHPPSLPPPRPGCCHDSSSFFAGFVLFHVVCSFPAMTAAATASEQSSVKFFHSFNKHLYVPGSVRKRLKGKKCITLGESVECYMLLGHNSRGTSGWLRSRVSAVRSHSAIRSVPRASEEHWRIP